MPDRDDYKGQRDRYIAFSLAAADLLVEIDAQSRIVRAIGATNALLAESAQDLKGLAVDELFPVSERYLVARLIGQARDIGRIDPATVRLQPADRKPQHVNLGACYLPEKQRTYVTVTVLSDALARTLPARDDVSGLLNMCDFQHMAARSINPSDTGSGAAMLQEMQLIRLNGLASAMEELPQSRSQQLMAEIGALLRASSGPSGNAARLGDEEFGLLSGRGPNAVSEDRLKGDIQLVLSNAGVQAERVSSSVVTLSLDTAHLSEESVTKALSYVMDSFAKTPVPDAGSLQNSLNAAINAAVDQYARIKSVLAAGHFALHFQPVVEISSRRVQHYEALLRFTGGMDSYDTVRFSEQVGLAVEFDLAVCDKAIEALKRYPGETIAVNLSGLSVQNAMFRERLNATLRADPALKDRLMFELTESHVVEDVEEAARFLSDLRRRGFRICLDDFGAGAAAYNYLRRFDVDYIKIDGPFLKTALTQPRQRALIHSISVLSRELKCICIGEMIENEDMARLATDLGIAYGQGWLFGKPAAEIAPRADAVARAIARRRGVQESWG
ncbi:MAG: EAL domain-containing protein [Asticcacaulis sp.]